MALGREIIAGGGSTAIVSAILNPVDVVKTRRQLLPLDKKPVAIARDLYKAGGVRGLWSPGLKATVVREILYSGCTKGFYPHVRALVSGEGEPSLLQRALAAAITGTWGSVCANAIDLVKIRQFENPGRYANLVCAFGDIIRAEGFVSGLLVRGVSASAPRGAAIAIGEITTYDYTKQQLKRRVAAFDRADEPFSLHAVTSMVTGVVATTVASPFDVLKSRVMASSADTCRGFGEAFMSLARTEGPRGFLRGWWPNYVRLGPHAMLTFPLFEQMRWLLGLEYL